METAVTPQLGISASSRTVTGRAITRMSISETTAGRAGTKPVWPAGQVGEVTLAPRNPVLAGSHGTWTFRYVTGPYGVDDGGGLKFLLPIPSDRGVPQFEDPSAPEYVTVRNSGSARVTARWQTKAYVRPWVKGIVVDVTDGALSPGDVVELIWGDTSGGSPGASAQSYAEGAAPVRVLVDPFATNVYYDVPGETGVEVLPGPAAALVATVSSTSHATGLARMSVRAIDRFGNVAVAYRGSVTVSLQGKTVAVLDFAAADKGVRSLMLDVPKASGPVRFDVADERGMTATSNPIVAGPAERTLFWGDTQGQTGETVGAGSLTEFFEYARDCVQLDFVTHSANDFQVERDAYAEVLEVTDKYTQNGSFVAFGGFEWSGNTPTGGDHNVLYADNTSAPLLRSSHALLYDLSDVDTDCRTISDVYSHLRSENIDALTVAHVGGRVANLDLIETDMTPVLEMTSVHGWFEWFALDALRKGLTVGLIAASDDHSGRPGGSFPSLPVFGVRSGLAAVRSDELSRQGIMKALRRRDCYATTGERIVLSVASGEHRMGEAWDADTAPVIEVSVAGTAPIESIQVINADEVLAAWRPAVKLSQRRLRVSWKGARDKNRTRVQDWNGFLTISGANIESAQTWAFDHPDQGIVETGPQLVRWTSSTNGDHDGIVLDLDSRPETLNFIAGGVELELNLSEVGEQPVVIPVEAGIDRAVIVEWLPAEALSADASVTFDGLPLTAGRNVYLVKVQQADGHIAWASPLYVTKRA